MKIDVEGAEAEVLSGVLSLLASARPAIICEVDSRNVPPVVRLLKSMGYVLFDGDKPSRQWQPLDRACWNTVAL